MAGWFLPGTGGLLTFVFPPCLPSYSCLHGPPHYHCVLKEGSFYRLRTARAGNPHSFIPWVTDPERSSTHQKFSTCAVTQKIPLNLPAIAVCAGTVASLRTRRWQAGPLLIKGDFFGQSRFPPLKKGPPWRDRSWAMPPKEKPGLGQGG